MDPNMNMASQGNEVPPQPVYLIQLDPNVQIESQAIPLHMLENDIDGDLILPLLEQKPGQPLLFIEPLKEPRVGEYQKILTENKISHVANASSGLPITYNYGTESNTHLNHIQNSAIDKQNITMTSSTTSDVTNLKDKITITTTIVRLEPGCTKDFEHEIENNKMHPKQKIKNYVHISDVKAPPRAIAVLPTTLQLRGKYISPRRTLSARVRFGPVQGIRRTITRLEAKELSSAGAPIFLLNQDPDHVIHIDVSDKDKSNWIGLLPLGETSSPTLSTANVWLYEENNELYLLTVQPIYVRRPLRIGYSKKYVEDHGLQGAPVLDLETVNPVQWWCNECNRGLPSASILQRHTDLYHKDDNKSWRSTYRCRYCRRPFGRLFTLKRHMLINCLKKPQPSQTPENNQQPLEPTPEPEITSGLEDNRIPSDESFQNFANSLDFSTNLFDTDRIAGLDISGHSRVDSELNAYSIGFRDDNGLSNDLGFTKLTNSLENVQSDETDQGTKELLLDICAFCSQVVVKENKSKHLRQCPSRLICECGRVFRHKKSLSRHIQKCHPSEKPKKVEKSKKTPEDDKEMAYKCQECPYGFKRRGMLVNHLWRVHKVISTIPVEKKVRHYPCVACPKIYRSATKRDVHVKAHHPGIEKVRGLAIEGGIKSYQAASCTECFRQYATRAKLLQHVRAQHPHLAKVMRKPSIKKQTKSKTEDNTILNFLLSNH